MNALNTNFFLAVPLPDSVRMFMERRALQLKSELPFKSWTRPGDYHITLVFLGKGGFKQINQVKKELGPVIGRHSAFRITVDQIGTFGKNQQPRILWAGVSADEAMDDLQRDLHRRCADLGFDLDDRPFKPHITVARKWDSQDELDHSELEKTIDFDDKKGSWIANEVALYQTHPNQIPQYQALKLFSLR